MNRHFTNAGYYAKRTGKTLEAGVVLAVRDLRSRLRGEDPLPEDSDADPRRSVRDKGRTIRWRIGGRIRRATGRSR